MSSLDLDTDLFDYLDSRCYGDVHFKVDRASGLHAIVAIHNSQLGPALGGCRYLSYPNTTSAFRDVCRLARAMSCKAALVNIPHGGGKSVIIKSPKQTRDRRALFQAFGQFINQLGGRYIAAIDSGTNIQDMDCIAEVCDYVTCTSKTPDTTSQHTAHGIFLGIKAAVAFKLDKVSLEGVHVAIQGVGQVGYYLAKELAQHGARVSVSDLNANAVGRCQTEFDATPVAAADIYGVQCDVFAPCALGAIINDTTLAQLQTKIIAGSANNQLELPDKHGRQVFEQGILYAPDYVINAGGLIYAAACYDRMRDADIAQRMSAIDKRLLAIFEQSAQQQRPTSAIAESMALAMLNQS